VLRGLPEGLPHLSEVRHERHRALRAESLGLVAYLTQVLRARHGADGLDPEPQP
jgi:hypothetical protein